MCKYVKNVQMSVLNIVSHSFKVEPLTYKVLNVCIFYLYEVRLYNKLFVFVFG